MKHTSEKTTTTVERWVYTKKEILDALSIEDDGWHVQLHLAQYTEGNEDFLHVILHFLTLDALLDALFDLLFLA